MGEMENKSTMGVFNDIFNTCTDLETLYETKSKNPIKNFFDERTIKKTYNEIYEQIKIIDGNSHTPEKLVDAYLDCLGSSRSSFGHCKKINKIRDLYVASFEFKMFDNNKKYEQTIVADIAQIINGGFGHVLAVNFYVSKNGNIIDHFSTNYDAIINHRDDEIDMSDIADKSREKYRKSIRSEFIDILQEDIYLFLKEFVDNSRNRLERKRCDNGNRKGRLSEG